MYAWACNWNSWHSQEDFIEEANQTKGMEIWGSHMRDTNDLWFLHEVWSKESGSRVVNNNANNDNNNPK